MAIVNTGPADDAPNCSALFATLVHTAQRRLWITSPYFVPDDVMVGVVTERLALRFRAIPPLRCGVVTLGVDTV